MHCIGLLPKKQCLILGKLPHVTFAVFSLERGADGSVQVQKVQCARVYHINIVLRIRTSLQDVRKDKAYREKSLQIQR